MRRAILSKRLPAHIIMVMLGHGVVENESEMMKCSGCLYNLLTRWSLGIIVGLVGGSRGCDS